MVYACFRTNSKVDYDRSIAMYSVLQKMGVGVRGYGMTVYPLLACSCFWGNKQCL